MKRDDWECEFGPFHIFDPEDIEVCFGCQIVTFHCANCERPIAKMALRDCPEETHRVLAELALNLGDGNGRESH